MEYAHHQPEQGRHHEVASWTLARTEAATLADEIQQAASRSRLWQLLHTRRLRAIAYRQSELTHLRREIRRRLAEMAVGATSNWTALSGSSNDGLQIALERTLRRLIEQHRTDHPAWAGRAARLALDLPECRCSAHHGDASAIDTLHVALLELGSAAPEPATATDIEFHLPGDLRRMPSDIESLCRMGSPYTLQVSIDDPIGASEQRYLKLHDIVIDRRLRGSGLGSSLLVLLCRFADTHHLPIGGVLEPGPSVHDEQVVRRLARWYHRHGFRQGAVPPDQWPRHSWIQRPPAG